MKYFLSLLLLTIAPISLSAAYDLFKKNPYSTHQPVLYAVVKSTSGPVIEFGTGFGSTDLLHEMCKKEGRILISLDDDREWLSKFKKKYLGDGYKKDNSGWHKFYYVPGRNGESPNHWVNFINNCKLIQDLTFDVCFIDQAPWLARFETLKLMKEKSLFILVHDVDYFARNKIFGTEIKQVTQDTPGIYDFSDVLTHSKTYFPNAPWVCETGPPTLLGSQFTNDFPKVDFSSEIVIEE